jgi:hypothetical protein
LSVIDSLTAARVFIRAMVFRVKTSTFHVLTCSAFEALPPNRLARSLPAGRFDCHPLQATAAKNWTVRKMLVVPAVHKSGRAIHAGFRGVAGRSPDNIFRTVGL